MTADIHRRGFTLMEVNLAIFVMAVAVLGMVALYPLGFRENQQARDDIAAAAVADGILNPIVAALSATNISWGAWMDMLGNETGHGIYIYPSAGWKNYCDGDYNPNAKGTINSTSRGVIDKLCRAYSQDVKTGAGNPASDAKKALDGSGMCCALVATTGRAGTYRSAGTRVGGEWCEPDYSRIQLTLRISRRPQQLFDSPVFYTEVHYQGDPSARKGGAE